MASQLGKALDAEWVRWLKANVARGCERSELDRVLIEEGFDAQAVRAAFDQVARELAPSPEDRASITLNLPRARRFASPAIELYTAEEFLSPSECAELVKLVKAALRPSTISTPLTGEPDAAFRTSRTGDLVGNHKAIANLDAKICKALGVDPVFGEPSQGQWYDVGQEFKPHTDFFKPYELEKFSTPAWGQRSWTFMIYLNVPHEGGATRFVDVDLTVEPKLGMALTWNNLLASGAGNPKTRHQGMPVTGGRKVIITKWFRHPPQVGRTFMTVSGAWRQKFRPPTFS